MLIRNPIALSVVACLVPLSLGGFTAAFANQPVVSLQSLLEEMANYDSVARWPAPAYTCRQASSYDRGTVAPDKPGWFANTDQNQFIRTETNQGRAEKVMMDADGPGCIVRFWLTTGGNKKGTLRFYLDGATEPALTFPAYDLLSGDFRIGPPLVQPHPGYRPDGNGGNNFYLPIPYAKHCKITWNEASDGARYYQINYRTYAFPGTSSNVPPQPREAALPVPTLPGAVAAPKPVRKPGAIECESMTVVAKSGDFFAGAQDMKPFGAERWSGGTHLLSQSKAVGDSVEIEWPAPDDAPRKLVLYATQAPDYGELRFTINGKSVTTKFDGYAESVRPAPVVSLGVFEPRNGKYKLRVEVVGANPASKGAKYYFGLDCMVMDKPAAASGDGVP